MKRRKNERNFYFHTYASQTTSKHETFWDKLVCII